MLGNRNYRFRDFLKPTSLEAGIMVTEGVLYTLPVFTGCALITDYSIPEIAPLAAAISIGPQMLTYMGFRGLELWSSFDNKRQALGDALKKNKIPKCQNLEYSVNSD